MRTNGPFLLLFQLSELYFGARGSSRVNYELGSGERSIALGAERVKDIQLT